MEEYGKDCRGIYLILNPKSGKGGRRSAKRNALVQARRLRDRLGVGLELLPTAYAGHATELSKALSQDDGARVVAIGGDGTVNETASGLIGGRSPLGIVPMGSGNGLARHLGVPLGPTAAVNLAFSGRVIDMDCGVIGGRHFFTTAGVGLDAEVGWAFANLSGRGLANYIRATTELFFRYRPKRYRIEVDGQVLEREALMVTFANASQFGNNAIIAPHARVNDGWLDMVIVKPFPKVAIGVLASMLMSGRVDRVSYVESIRFRHTRVELEGEQGKGHVDGEPFALEKSFEVSVVPSALRAIAGVRAKEIREMDGAQGGGKENGLLHRK